MSLRTRLIIVLCLSLLAAATVFAVVNEMGRFLVWRYYVADNAKQERIDEKVEDFQQYVMENKLYIDDYAAIKKWHGGQYVDIVVYKDESLMYAPNWFKDFEGGSGESGIFNNPFFKNPWISGDRGFEQYLTEDAKTNYLKQLNDILEGNRELVPVIFMDGTALVTVVDYTEDFFYSGVLVMAFVSGLSVLALIMIFNFTSMAIRVNRLAQNVRLVEEGDLNMPIKLDGNDELTALADDVNSMRNSVVDNMTKERQAWEANAALITAMSHDIRTPLTVVLGYLDLIELQNEDPANVEYIAACKENTMRLKTLSDDMFSYFLVFGKHDALLESISYHGIEAVYQMIAEHELLLVEKGYTFDVNLPMDKINVKIDAVYFGRVIDNIFSNLGKYADPTKPISISAEHTDDAVLITFANVIKRDDALPESNHIGIKTCVRIMERMNGSFKVDADEENFRITVKIPAEYGDELIVPEDIK